MKLIKWVVAVLLSKLPTKQDLISTPPGKVLPHDMGSEECGLIMQIASTFVMLRFSLFYRPIGRTTHSHI